MKRFDKEFRLLFIGAALAATLGAFNADDRMLKKAGQEINGAAYRSHIEGLASDEMEGRSPGSEGERKTIEYLEKEFLELGLQPLTGGDFRQDVALVEITGSDQKLSFNKGAGGMTLAMGDDMVLGTRRVQAGILDRGQRGRVRRLRHRCARVRLERLRGHRHARQDRADPRERSGLRDRRRDALSRQGDDLPRPLDLQVRGSRAQGRSGSDHRARDRARVLRLGRCQEWLVWPAVLPGSAGRQCRPDGARRLDHRRARAAAHGTCRPGFRRDEGGRRQARVQAGAARRYRDRRGKERDSPQALAESRRTDAWQGPAGGIRHLRRALGPSRRRRGARRRPHLQRRRRQCDGRCRDPHDRARIPQHAARGVAVGAVHRGHRRGIGAASAPSTTPKSRSSRSRRLRRSSTSTPSSPSAGQRTSR